jgi:hypothetical protein
MPAQRGQLTVPLLKVTMSVMVNVFPQPDEVLAVEVVLLRPA